MVRLYTAAASAVAIVENGNVKLTLEERGARCLAVDPKDPDTVYAGTSDEGLFKSSDAGRTWEHLHSGATHPRITAVAVSPVDGALYAGTEPSVREPGWRRVLAGIGGPEEPTFILHLELPAPALDLPCPLNCPLSRR